MLSPVLPFILLALFAAGILTPSPPFPLSLLLTTINGAISLYCHRTDRSMAAIVFLLIFFYTLGLCHPPAVSRPDAPAHVYNQVTDREEVTLLGCVAAMPDHDGDATRLLLDSQAIIKKNGSWPATGMVRLLLPFDAFDAMLPGTTILARATVRKRLASRNPGITDWLAARDIWLTAKVPSPAFLSIVDTPLQTQYAAERIRHFLTGRLTSLLPSRQASLYRALLVGDRSGISPRLLTTFKRAGIMHLLAISGLHMGMLGLFSFACLFWLLRRSTRLMLLTPVWKIAALLTLVPMALYALVAGLQPPVIRAFIMAGVAAIAITIDRRWSLAHAALAAAFCIVVISPTSVYRVSFQLTFAAICGIALFYRPLVSALDRKTEHLPWQALCRKIGTGLVLSVTAMIGTLPLILFYFQRFSPWSPLSTLLIGPIVCFWSLPLGLAACLLLPVAPGLAAPVLAAGGLGLEVSTGLAELFAGLPGAALYLPPPNSVEIFCYFFLLVGLRYAGSSRWARLLLPAALSGILASLAISVGSRYLNETATITCLDVGHGSATLVELPGNRNLLIDGGGYSSPTFDVGRRIIAPVLWKKRITSLAAVIITHPHADHYNGLFFILHHFRPKTLFVSSRNGATSYARLLSLAGRLNIPIQVATDSSVLYRDDNTVLRTVPGGGAGNTVNDDSLVLRLTAMGSSMLFPGDIGTAIQNTLAQSADRIRSDVLLLSHHGRQRNAPFIRAVDPQWLLVSTADPQTGNRQHEYATARCGAISVRFHGGRTQVTPLAPDCKTTPENLAQKNPRQ